MSQNNGLFLFSYRRKAKGFDENGNQVDVMNDNFINPLNVVSFFWNYNQETGRRQLSVFLSNNFPVTFAEQPGERFVAHMERVGMALLHLVGRGGFHQSLAPGENPRPKSRQPIQTDEDVVEDSPAPAPAAQWS